MTPDLLDAIDRVVRNAPVVCNAARRSTGTHLTWGETAALVKPGHRHAHPGDLTRGGMFQTPSGLYGRISPYRPDAGRKQHQEALASEDERMHGEIHSILPGMTVQGFHGDYMTEPFVTGSSTAGIAELRRRLAGAGYTRNPDNRSVTDIEYTHPEGHRIILGSHPSTGWFGRRRRVEYYPAYKPDAVDGMSRAADAASLLAHQKTGAAESPYSSGFSSANHAPLLEAAALHGEAALAHGIAFDKAAEEGRTEDAARHARAVSYHQFVASKL